MAIQSLSYDALSEMKFNDFKKAVKEKSQWRKARALVLLFDYKMKGKKTPVLLPLRRPNQLKPLLKQIKADKHPNQKLAAGTFVITKGEKGPEVVFTMTHGGYKLSAVETKIAPLFKRLLKMDFRAEQGQELPLETAENVVLDNSTETPVQETEAPQEKEMESKDRKAQREATHTAFKKVKDTYKKDIQPIIQRFKDKANTLLDADTLRDALKEVNHFMEAYQNSDPEWQKKLAPTHKKYQKDQVQLSKMATKLDAIDIPPSAPEEDDQALANIQKPLDEWFR